MEAAEAVVPETLGVLNSRAPLSDWEPGRPPTADDEPPRIIDSAVCGSPTPVYRGI